MKLLVSTLTLAAALGMTIGGANLAVAQGCGASGSCGASASCGDKVASACEGEKKSDCAAACAASCGGEQVAMAKGGADNTTVEGYGLGKKVPNFSLEDIHGNTHTLNQYEGKITALIFWNQACPFVVEMHDRLNTFTDKYKDKDVVVLAIDAGINNSVEDIKKYGADRPFHILLNRDSELARKFDAKFTPEVFLLNTEGVVVYHGAFDNGRAGAGEGARRTYMEDAVTALLEGRAIDVNQTRAFGCTIKFAPQG